MSQQSAPFYVLKMARDRLLSAIEQAKTDLTSLISLASAATRKVQPVTQISSLSNAQAALTQLSQAMAARTGTFTDIATVPAFSRFQSSIHQFLNTEGKKVRQNGTLTQTPQQAQSQIQSTATQLRKDWDTVLSLATLWADAMEVYTALNLPSVLSATVLANSSSQLASLVAQFTSLSPTDRLGLLQDAVVQLTSMTATVQGFGSLTAPTTYIPMTGVASVYADADHPVIEAELLSDFYEGYSIYSGHNTLQLQIDGQYNMTINPPGSFVARIDCPSRGPYKIVAPANVFTLGVIHNWNAGTITLSNDIVILAGDYVQPWDVAVSINNQGGGTFLSHLFFSITQTTQSVSCVDLGGGVENFTLIASTTWAALGVTVGSTIIVTDTTSPGVDNVWTITGLAGNVATASLESTSVGSSLPDTSVLQVAVGSDANIQFYIQLAQTSYALSSRSTLSIKDGVGSSGTLTQMSLYTGAKIDSVRTSAATFSKIINQTAQGATLDGVARISASSEVIHSFHTGLGRTNPSNAQMVTFYDAAGQATILSSTPTSTVLQNADVAALGTGATVVVRTSNVSTDVGKYGTITSVTGDQFTINKQLLGAGTVSVEAAYNNFYTLSNTRAEVVVTINENQIFDGTYTTSTTAGPTPLDILLSSTMPGVAGLGGNPIVIANLQIGQNKLAITSQDNTLRSSVTVLGTGNFDAAFVNGPFPRTVISTTTWVKLPSIPVQLSEGDIFEVYHTRRDIADYSIEISTIDTVDNLIQLSEPLPGNLTGLTLSTTNVLPFARIRKGIKDNYDSVAANVTTWLSSQLVSNELLTFRAVDAVINPLVSGSPSMPQSVSAQQQFTQMLNALNTLEGYLNAYTAPVVSAVDALVKGFLQKGLDRAVDVLLAADFASFFSLDSQTGSYLGSLQKAISNVQVTDLPMRKDNRTDSVFAYAEQTIAQYDDVDFNYTPDPQDPATNAVPSEPSSPSFRQP